MEIKIATRKIVTLIVLALSLMILLQSCSTTKTSDQSSAKSKLAELRKSKLYKEKEVTIADNSFYPKFLEIEPNTIVIFKNSGIAIHDVKSDTTPEGDIVPDVNFMNSDNLKSKDMYVVLFTKAGEYGYHCHFHGGPKFGQYGTITVKEAK